jgi:hypothetical protein
MPVKNGNCVKTGATVLVLDYGYAQRADIFLLGDTLVLNFGANILEGHRVLEKSQFDYQVVIGMEGFYHEGKNVLVVPKWQFQGEIIHRNGCKELCKFGAKPTLEEQLQQVTNEARQLGYGITYWSPSEMRGVSEDRLLDLVVPYGNDRIAELAGPDDEEE